jgi:flagellar basal body L-ring protein FlgH
VTSSAAPVPPSVQPTPAHSGLSLAKEESGLAAKAEALAELEKRVPRATFEDVDLSKSLEAKSGDILMGEILERFPNGNYKIRAVKRVIYKYGPPRVVSIIGVVKASDINEETDQIHSERLYEYRVDVAH